MSSNNPGPARIPPNKPAALKGASPRAEQAMALRKSGALADSIAATPADVGSPQGDIVARGAWDYRWKRYLMVLLLIGMGGWFGYDGYKGWPAENARIAQLQADLDSANKRGDTLAADKIKQDKTVFQTPHSMTDIRMQIRLAFGLPLASAFMLAWFLYNSRGEYRLAGNTLSIPGFPPVQLQDIIELDKHLWDRKGIAYVICKTGTGKVRMRLDDFVYEQDPTNEIYKRLLAHLGGATS